MAPLGGHSTNAAAELALFALWCGCAPAGPGVREPAFSIDGLVTGATSTSLQEAAALLVQLAEPCCLIAGRDDLSAPGATLQVTVSRVTPEGPSALDDLQAPRRFRFPADFLPPDIAPEGMVLVFGGYTRLRTFPADIREAQATFGLFGPFPSACADLADSPWAEGLLPAADRDGVEWVVMLGRSVAFDPPWSRDAVQSALSDERLR